MNLGIPMLLVAVSGVLLTGCANRWPEPATDNWLKLQSSGAQASVNPQPATVREREEASQRWLNSYEYAIPYMFIWTKMESDEGK